MSRDRHPRAAARASLALWSSLALLPLACAGDGDGMDDDETGSSASEGSGGADGASSGDAPFDEAEVIEQAGQYATALVQINDQPFGSQHGLADTVNVYVDAANADLYRTLDPAAPADIDFPEGALIVKEHLAADGSADGYLMMYQGPDGYAPDANDWFWARVDGSGATQETGAVAFCISCHAQAPAHILGVATDNRR
jgi:Cytochrome P460